MNTFKLGLCSVTFRKKTAAEIVSIAEKAGVSYIEWGGDIHVRTIDDAQSVKALCSSAGIKISSYGSYFNCAEYDEKQWRNVCEIADLMSCVFLNIH